MMNGAWLRSMRWFTQMAWLAAATLPPRVPRAGGWPDGHLLEGRKLRDFSTFADVQRENGFAGALPRAKKIFVVISHSMC